MNSNCKTTDTESVRPNTLTWTELNVRGHMLASPSILLWKYPQITVYLKMLLLRGSHELLTPQRDVKGEYLVHSTGLIDNQSKEDWWILTSNQPRAVYKEHDTAFIDICSGVML